MSAKHDAAKPKSTAKAADSTSTTRPMPDDASATLPENAPRLVILTGLAGAGHSTALKILEDRGYRSVDNMPMALVGQLVSMLVEAGGERLALALDNRTAGFDPEAVSGLLDDLKRRFAGAVRLIFLTANRATRRNRYSTTRRQHPLAGVDSLENALRRDEQRMQAVQHLADRIICTDGVTPSALRAQLLGDLGLEPISPLPLRIFSFSWRNGIPADAEIVHDMRCLRNPFWQSGLAELSGEDAAVQAFIAEDPLFATLMEAQEKILLAALPRYRYEGKPVLNIGFGCTGGRHRSVFAACWLAERMRQHGHPVECRHRDLPRS